MTHLNSFATETISTSLSKLYQSKWRTYYVVQQHNPQKESAVPVSNSNPSTVQKTLHLINFQVLEMKKKTDSFSSIERVILSTGAMLIVSVSFQHDQIPAGNRGQNRMVYMAR